MLKFSRREDYSIILVYELTKSYKKRYLPLSEVANEYKISILFLRNLAAELRKSGLISAIEGKNGGYQLTKDPENVTVGEVLKIFGAQAMFECCSYGDSLHKKGKKCPKQSFCDPGFVWRNLHKEFLNRIYGIKLTKFVDMRKEQGK